LDRTIVFDGDDTLWFTEPLYDEARTTAREIVEQAGLDGAAWEQLQRKLDLANVEILGLAPTRFPTSCQQACEQVSIGAGRDVDLSLTLLVYHAAERVFEQPAPVQNAARQVLESLRDSWKTVLFTKGDATVQERRVRESGLGPLFTEIRVVDQKSSIQWFQLIEDLSVNVERSWSVGNSIPSDIVPAIENGMSAAWIPAHVWEHEAQGERPVSPRFVELKALEELPDLLAEHSG
jgi:putative hydrolase of the HAD superfamily